MTLRDYFAGQAMVAYTDDNAMSENDVARFSYALADAMLKERAKAQKEGE
jgi:hypothetical protein